MIITCPECAARYDVDDDRFSPDGRSVRCSSCGESWFVPAPEPLDMQPLDDDGVKSKKAARDQVEHDEDARDNRKGRLKVALADDDEEPRKKRNNKPAKDGRSLDAGDEEEDDSLFESSRGRNKDSRDYDDDDEGDPRSSKKKYSRNDEDEDLTERPRKGKNFVIEEDEDEDVERRPFFARRRKNKEDDESVSRDKKRESLRFADEEDDDRSDYDDRNEEDDRDYDDRDDDNVVDADWEAIDEDGDRPRGFGRRIRAERRRATALARMEDVRPIDPEDLDDEFFAALRVTPRELEKAIRKARRRAEAREKNRLTPLRVFGWTTWLAAIVGGCYVMVAYKDDIVKMAPKAADAYAVIGIEATPYGLAIENVRHRLAISTAGPTIEITGNLRNETEGAVTAPLLQAEALGARGELLSRWTFAANDEEVAEGGEVNFMTRVPAPEGVTEVALSFAPSKSVLDSLLSSED